MIQLLTIICGACLCFFLLIGVICTFIASFTISKKFDKRFKDLPADIFDPQNMFSSKFLYRPSAYMLSIAAGKRFSNNPNNFKFYGDYDFRANATKAEIRFSYFYMSIIYAAGFFLIAGCIMFVIAKIMHVAI